MTDMLVKLYTLADISQQKVQIETSGVSFKRALAMDKNQIIEFVRRHFGEVGHRWASECAVALLRYPTASYVAVLQKKSSDFMTQVPRTFSAH